MRNCLRKVFWIGLLLMKFFERKGILNLSKKSYVLWLPLPLPLPPTGSVVWGKSFNFSGH